MMLTLSSYIQILTLFSAMSMPSEADVQPQFDWSSSTIYNSLYFVVFMIIAHGTVQLFVGVSMTFGC
jgi:hypothetical protein